MSRVLVFGGDGLLGSHLYQELHDKCELAVTLHGSLSDFPEGLFAGAHVIERVDAADDTVVTASIAAFRPDWIINAIGLVKRDRAGNRVASLQANTLFPHLLAQLSLERGARLMHFSTDCVFSGERGMYRESDRADCQEWHGLCKALGEPIGESVLVLRTSFVGLELRCRRSLIEWFLAQRGRVPGYRRALWSGLTAAEIARVVIALISREEALAGLWHVAGQPISKFDLLTALNVRLNERGVSVIPDDSFVCDRRLDGGAFQQHVGYTPPEWGVMLDELADDIRCRWHPDRPAYWRCS